MRLSRRQLFVLLSIPACFLVVVAVTAAILVSFGKRDRARKADAILIFGARVWPDGKASPILRARTRRGFELWKQGLAPTLVCTGGVGTYAPAEAEVSAALLREWGVPESAIIIENKSTSTTENVRFAAKLLDADRRSVIAVSDPFHLWRCTVECRRAGLTPYPSPSPGYYQLRLVSQIYYAIREALLVPRTLLNG